MCFWPWAFSFSSMIPLSAWLIRISIAHSYFRFTLLCKPSVCFADDVNIYIIPDCFYSSVLRFQSHYLSLFNTRYAESFIIYWVFEEMRVHMLCVLPPRIQGMSQFWVLYPSLGRQCLLDNWMNIVKAAAGEAILKGWHLARFIGCRA